MRWPPSHQSPHTHTHTARCARTPHLTSSTRKHIDCLAFLVHNLCGSVRQCAECVNEIPQMPINTTHTSKCRGNQCVCHRQHADVSCTRLPFLAEIMLGAAERLLCVRARCDSHTHAAHTQHTTNPIRRKEQGIRSSGE